MSDASVGGIIAQGTKVEKLQEVQHQGPEWQKQRARTVAEEEKLRQQKQVRKAPKGERNLSVTERDQRQQKRQRSDDSANERIDSRQEKRKRSRKSRSGHNIDIVV